VIVLYTESWQQNLYANLLSVQPNILFICLDCAHWTRKNLLCNHIYLPLVTCLTDKCFKRIMSSPECELCVAIMVNGVVVAVVQGGD
jgi:hypothetical protein